MTRTIIAASVVLMTVTATAAPRQAQNPFESPAVAAPRGPVDQIVFARLARLAITPAPLASDAVFVRRVFLDVIGTLPRMDEVRTFFDDPSPSKRQALIDRLLERPEYTDYWALKWGDVLRIKSEFPINLWPNAVQAYHRWVRTAVRDNVPYDRFVRELLTQSGSNFRVAPVNFYRAVQSKDPRTIASAVALTFMGTRTETWPKQRLDDLSAFFARIGYKPTGEWKEEIVFFDADKDASGLAPSRLMVFPDGTTARVARGEDPRIAFAAWLMTPTNPWFARTAVNRLWYWLMGRGIIDEPDDIRSDNPPSNPELLAYLEKEFVASKYDVKAVLRLILNSATYQLSSLPRTATPAADANFAHALIRPLDAEVLIDALNQITGASEEYQSAIPEPYTFIPSDQRTIALGDGSITSAFLETFGRPPRDTGLASERSRRPTAAQRLQLLNGGELQRKLQQGPTLQALLQSGNGQQVLDTLYLTILSRLPTTDEVMSAGAYTQSAGGNRRQAAIDIAWALINSTEFRYRH
ncbi:MAG: DUF1553 domain-containing protein [Acidobacteriota bacterium]